MTMRSSIMRVMGSMAALATLAWLLRSAEAPAQATPVPRTALGAHTLVGQEEDRSPPVARTPSLATAAHGSSLLALTAGYVENNTAPRDSYKNRWRPLGPPVPYRGYGGRFDMRAYVALDARGGAGHTVEVAKPGQPRGELTLIVVEALRAGRLVDYSQVYPQPALHQVSGQVKTDGPALLVAVWLGDTSGLRHVAMPGEGFRVINSFTRLPPNSAVQAVVAVREVDRAGSWRANWYAVPEQGAILWLLAFARKPDASGGRSAQLPAR